MFFQIPNGQMRVEEGPFNSSILNLTNLGVFVIPRTTSRKRDTPSVSVTYTSDGFSALLPNQPSGLTTGAIVGIVVGSVLLVVVIASGLFVWKCYHQLPTFMRISRSDEETWR